MLRGYKYDTVLLIDDNYIDNVINQKIISSSNFAKNIISFESARLATYYLQDIIEQQSALPEVIFLDLRMPDTDGYAFLQQIEKISDAIVDKVKIYVLSSSLDPLDRKKVKKNPLADLFISKPLTEQILKDL